MVKRRCSLTRFVKGPAHASCLLALLAFLSLSVRAETFALVVSGLGGEPVYSESFDAAARSYAEALNSLDAGNQQIVYLQEGATREQILEGIKELATAMQASQAATFVLILVGHGTTDSETWRFNIEGPDLSTEDLIVALDDVPSARQLVVLAASASGSALAALSDPRRVVVTATKSGGEINAVRFPLYLADAMKSNVADFDRNEILTVAEAFRYANARTKDYYEQQKLLAPEHARLQGDLAEDIPLALLGSLKQAQDDPEVAKFLSQRLVLETQFKTLKARKPQMPLGEYYQELEVLMLEIARLQQAIDAVTGWSESDAES